MKKSSKVKRFIKLSQNNLNEIAEKLDRIPRKSLDYFSPIKILYIATGRSSSCQQPNYLIKKLFKLTVLSIKNSIN